MTDNRGDGRARRADRALVSDGAPADRHPSGFDPSRGDWEPNDCDRRSPEVERLAARLAWARGGQTMPLSCYDLDRAEEIWTGEKVVPRPPAGASIFAVKCDTGEWFYVNHAGTWQTMPNPIRDSDGSPKGGDGEAGSVHDSAGCDSGIAQPEAATKDTQHA